jgi:hypothetical protein
MFVFEFLHKPKYVQNSFKIKEAYAPQSQTPRPKGVTRRFGSWVHMLHFLNVMLRYLKILEKI